MDSERYEEWNPFIIKMEGVPAKGQKIKNTMMNGDKPMSFEPTVTALEENHYFEWLGSLPLNMFNGRHYFRLKAENGGTLLEHGEFFTGWLKGLLLRQIGETTRNGFIAMNQALCEQAEKATLSFP